MKEIAEQEVIEVGDFDVEAFNEFAAEQERWHAALHPDGRKGGEVR